MPPHTMDNKSLAGAVGHLTEVHHKNFCTTLNFCTTSVVQNLFFENIIHGLAQSKSEMRGTVLVFLFRYTDGEVGVSLYHVSDRRERCVHVSSFY